MKKNPEIKRENKELSSDIQNWFKKTKNRKT